ncbi:RidA family protein [Hahella ganghwensis]|uniref:RidA family protein n=1 Tax=Hahella ganghwensis TaxID=286420 RepID=UPI0003806234|nr:RidA family protein [Hahella ganghwensis]
MSDIKRHVVTPRASDMVAYNGVLRLVDIPPTEDGDITSQTRGLLEDMEQMLIDGGSSKSHLLMATIYLTDMADYDAFNAVWDEWLPEGTAPVRACIKVAGLALPGWKVEIAAEAALIDSDQ